MWLTIERKQELKEQTLKWCNERRREQRKPALNELPKGLRHDPKSCPCGAATGLIVGMSTARTPERIALYEPGMFLPLDVRLFIMHFDGGEFPELTIEE